MTARWLVMTLLLHSAVPAMAQLAKDPENPDIVHNDTPTIPKNAVPPSQVNADTAAVSPAAGSKKSDAKQADCSTANPCATPTPAAR
jgi:hypothetical protein